MFRYSLPALPAPVALFTEIDFVENAETEEWVGLWGIYVYYGGEVDGGGGEDELRAGSYG